MMKKLLGVLSFLMVGVCGFSQAVYIPSKGSPTAKPIAPSAGVPSDARSYYYDSLNFRWRPYLSTAEVLSFMPASLRRGHFPVIVNTGGSLSNGVITGGTNQEYWFKDGIADSNLVIKSNPGNVGYTIPQLRTQKSALNNVFTSIDGGTFVDIGLFDSQYSDDGVLYVKTANNRLLKRSVPSNNFPASIFGMVPDGVTDNTAAFQNAINLIYKVNKGGTLVLGIGNYKVTGTIYGYQNVNIIGQDYEQYDYITPVRGSRITHVPTLPNTDFLVIKRDTTIGGTYGNIILKDFKVLCSKTNTRNGISLVKMKAIVQNLEINGCANAALNISGAVQTQVLNSRLFNSDYGVYIGGETSTTLRFEGNYFGLANRIGIYTANAVDVTLTNRNIFEGCTGAAMDINNTNFISTDSYFEDCHKEFAVAGTHGQTVLSFTFNGTAVFNNGGNNLEWYDAFLMDRVDNVNLHPTVLEVPKASILRTTANTGNVNWTFPQHSILGSASPRTNSTAYSQGQKMQVVCDDGFTRVFIATQAGTSAASAPTFSRVDNAKADGTVIWKSVAPGVIYNQSKMTQYSSKATAGKLISSKVVTAREDVEYQMAAGFSFAPNDFSLTRQNALRPILYSDPTTDKIAIGTYLVAPAQTVRIENAEAHGATGNSLPALVIRQEDNTQAITNIIAQEDAASVTKPISTSLDKTSLVQGAVKTNINGSTYWTPYFTAPPLTPNYKNQPTTVITNGTGGTKWVFSGNGGGFHEALSTFNQTNGDLIFFRGFLSSTGVDSARTEEARFNNEGKFGINMQGSNPVAYQHIKGTTEQLRLGYDDNNYFKAVVGQYGNTTFTAVGPYPSVAFNNPVAAMPAEVDGHLATLGQVKASLNERDAANEFTLRNSLAAGTSLLSFPNTNTAIAKKLSVVGGTISGNDSTVIVTVTANGSSGSLTFTADGTATSYTFVTTSIAAYTAASRMFFTPTTSIGFPIVRVSKSDESFTIFFAGSPTAGTQTIDYFIAP